MVPFTIENPERLIHDIVRLLTGCFIPVGSAVFGANFNLVTEVGRPYFFFCKTER